MRRKDREIKDFDQIIEIIEKCDVCRIGLEDGDFPYIVPMNFGYRVNDGQIVFYLHGAKEGRKMELIKKSGLCSFEMDCEHVVEMNAERGYATMRFKSVMGKGVIEILSDEEKKEGLDIFMEHYAPDGFEYDHRSIPVTAVMKMTVTEITGKANQPK